MKIPPTSIKGRLFFWLLITISCLLVTLGFALYYEVKNNVLASLDNVLYSKMQLVTGFLHEEHGKIELELSEIIAGEYNIPRSGHYYKVIMGGKVFAVSPSLVDERFELESGALESDNKALRKKIYTSRGPDNEPIRVLRHDFEFLGRETVVFTAEDLRESLRMINSFRKFLLVIIPLSILLVSLIGLLIAKKSLKPLKMFSSNIEQITHKTLSGRVNAQTEAEELTGLADSFNRMLERLQKAFEAERRLISDASHELKTPVSVLKVQCDVTLQKERTNEEYMEALETVRTISGNMGSLISDLLSVARLDSGILSPEDFKPLPLRECVEKAVRLTEPIAEKKQVTVSCSVPDDITVIGDKDRLTEAFLNLIANAVRYNKDGGGEVRVSARRGARFKGQGSREDKDLTLATCPLPPDRDFIEISVEDTGIGIKENDLERIFERFYRADTSRNTEGTGLGLSIAKAIIDAHGGKIRAESHAGRGSCFTVTLPLIERRA